MTIRGSLGPGCSKYSFGQRRIDSARNLVVTFTYNSSIVELYIMLSREGGLTDPNSVHNRHCIVEL